VEIQFPEILPFSLVSLQPNVSCVGVSCEWQLAGITFTSGTGIVTDRIPIDLIDLEQPVVISYTANISTGGGNFIIVAKTDVSIINLDENGTETKELLTTVNQGTTDITSFLQGKTGFLEYDYTPATCPSACVITLQLRSPSTNTIAGLITSFQLDPPEIDETSSALLRQKDFLIGSEITQTGQRFAVGESFQLKTVDATVITDFTMQMATQDPDVIVRGVIWDLNKSPPERVIESVENFTGVQLGNVLGNVKFTFPIVALIANQDVVCVTTPCLPQPISYAVGIRVDRNLDQSFSYLQADTTPDTHGAVIDSTPNINDETMFVDHGIIGIDINQDLAKGAELFEIFLQEMLPPEPVVCIALFAPVCGVDAKTYSNSCFAEGAGVEIAHDGECTIIDTMLNTTNGADDTTIIICEGISPEPPECQGIDTGSPTAEQCGITEVFINGQCRCVEPFKRAESGECGVVNESDKPPLLQIEGLVTVETFIIAGAVIIGGGVTGLVLRSRR
jgi:hypothetical protein